jgi:alkanesulfonate monooxygenase SsuD/methylene tetrahydromethanopterin reductase-like flavin-dependent oxidoreductase (luciferase family)
MSVFVELAVGTSCGQVSLAQADAIAAAAQEAGATGLRLVDSGFDAATVDPSIVGSYLAGRHGDLSYVIDAPTTRNAPYNLARRVVAFDRAADGRVGLVLRTGEGDEVSDAVQPAVGAADRAQRWAEYAAIATGLWESFPRNALLGDQAAALVVDETLIHPIDFDGRYYRVRGPLDGPGSVQGRPVLFAADVAELGWARIAQAADGVIVDATEVAGADDALSDQLAAMGRRRDEVALLARVSDVGALPAADGYVLALNRTAAGIAEAVRELVPQLRGAAGPTLREALVIG